MRLADTVRTILSLLKIRASPIRLSEHDVTFRREGDTLASRLDVADEELTVGFSLESVGGSVAIL
jgi:hypothetical protein